MLATVATDLPWLAQLCNFAGACQHGCAKPASQPMLWTAAVWCLGSALIASRLWEAVLAETGRGSHGPCPLRVVHNILAAIKQGLQCAYMLGRMLNCSSANNIRLMFWMTRKSYELQNH